ncbi:helix-turn-helix transcriptional regulator [Paenibacillus larvae]
MSSDVKEFGSYLRKLRKKQGLSTRSLAELSGVSQSYISHVEIGRKPSVPSPEILDKLATALGVPYRTLMRKAGYLDDERYISFVDTEIEIRLLKMLDKKEKRIHDYYVEELLDLFSKYDKAVPIHNGRLHNEDILNNVLYQIDDPDVLENLRDDILSIELRPIPDDEFDLHGFLNKPEIHYRTVKLDDQKKQLIFSYLDALFWGELGRND